ncbi:M1 family aminopeptidase [Aquimarina sp. 2201CG1-2-11]|uniref:M1 family aminopeptidase n=1 Tax=Aquimarina discodermiae TaxID=3231043 RepID=UPI003462F4B0
MKTTFTLLILFISLNFYAQKTVTYTVSKINKNTVPMLKIAASFPVTTTGNTTLLHYPNQHWGENNLHNCITSLTSLTENTKIEFLENKDSIIIHHDKGLKSIELEYYIKQDKGKELDHNNFFRPVIQSNYFHLFSHNLFMTPFSIIPGVTYDIQLIWKDFPKNYTIHNSFGSNQLKQKLTNIKLEDFKQAVFVGGDYIISSFKIKENLVYFATRGEWIPFNQTEIINLFTKTVESQRNFWNDHSQKYYTVVLSPINNVKSVIFTGTGLTNSFDAILSNNEHTSKKYLTYLFNHELLHNWTGLKIKNDNEEQQYWFSEGFTEYYTYKLIATNNINNNDEEYFLKKINAAIKELSNSKLKNVQNKEITYRNYWSTPGYDRIPYLRGALFAFYLDQKIHKMSNKKYGLDTIMRTILKDATTKGQKLTHDYFIKTVNYYLQNDITPVFNNFIEKGEMIPFETFFKEHGLQFTSTSTAMDIGFTYGNDQKITSIPQTSKAYIAGLREKDSILGARVYKDTTKLSTIEIARQGKKHNFSFHTSSKKIKLPQLKINAENKENLLLD